MSNRKLERNLRVCKVVLTEFDRADIDVNEVHGMCPTSKDEGTVLNTPRPIFVIQRTEGSVKLRITTKFQIKALRSHP